MVLETERAINILIEAQRRCEELYINSPEPSQEDAKDGGQ